MYHIAKFSDDTVEIVLEKWFETIIKHGIVDVAFPPKSDYCLIRKYLRDRMPSRSTWSTYTVEILFSHGKCFAILFILYSEQQSQHCLYLA